MLGYSSVSADFAIKDWRYEKTIATQDVAGLIELSFDEEVFAGAAQGLRDLRIISNTSREIPYKLVVEKSTLERSKLPGVILNKGFVPGEYSSFIVDLGTSGVIHNQIEISTPTRNFWRETSVEGSSDAEAWLVLQKKTIIYNFADPSVGLRSSSLEIAYPDSRVRYLRIKVANRDEEPIEISGASVFYEKTTPAKEVSFPATIIEQSLDEKNRASLVIVDLGSTGLPNNTLTVVTPDANFERNVGVEGSNDKIKWKTVSARDVIFSFRTPRFSGSKTEVSYPENTYRYLRLIIYNGDNEPLTASQVRVSGTLRKLVFETQVGESYKLFYGNSDARYPQYDIEKYFKYLETENIPEALLGAQIANSFFEEKLPPVSERSPWLLPGVLGIGVIILSGLLFQIFRTVRKRLPPSGTTVDGD